MGRKRGTRRLLRSEAKVVTRAAQTVQRADGDDGQLQFNSTGSFAGSNRLTFDGGSLELTGTLSTRGNLGVNMSGTAPTHGITLPDTSKNRWSS
jgi:hypothetical protein